MPRLARTVCAQVPHHITQRGNRREDIFFTDEDRQAYLDWLKEYAEKYEVAILAYCLMTNHIHLIAVPATETGLQQLFKPRLSIRDFRPSFMPKPMQSRID